MMTQWEDFGKAISNGTRPCRHTMDVCVHCGLEGHSWMNEHVLFKLHHHTCMSPSSPSFNVL